MSKVIVSDHAVVRYLERVDGPHPTDDRGRIDIAAVREIILADGRRAAFAAGASRIKIGDAVFAAGASISDPTIRVVITTIVGEKPLNQQKHMSNLRKPKNGRSKKHPRREEK